MSGTNKLCLCRGTIDRNFPCPASFDCCWRGLLMISAARCVTATPCTCYGVYQLACMLRLQIQGRRTPWVMVAAGSMRIAFRGARPVRLTRALPGGAEGTRTHGRGAAFVLRRSPCPSARGAPGTPGRRKQADGSPAGEYFEPRCRRLGSVPYRTG